MALRGRLGRGQGGGRASVAGRGSDLELRLLGGFELRVGGARLDLPPATQRVLAFLALHARVLRRPYVAGSLWPDTSDTRAFACLRTALWRVRAHEGSLITTTPGGLGLADGVRIDLIAHQRLARVLTRGGALESSDDPIGLEADLLPDWPDEWLMDWREAWHQARLHALEHLARSLAATRDYGRALAAGLAAVRADPLRESAHRVVIDIHLAEGNAGQAMRQYHACSRVLRSELGIEPSQLTRDLLPARLDSWVPTRPA